MAYIYPSDISKLALSDASRSEVATLKLLHTSLPNDYTVFHGVHWTREYEQWSLFGEIDFVILNRSGQVLFIEQKEGELEETSEGLVKRYGDDEKNPVNQLHRSIDKVRDKFNKQHKNKHRLTNVDYLIYLPGHTVRNLNAAGIDKSRIVDAQSKAYLAERIMQILLPGDDKDKYTRKIIEDFFLQSFELVPDIHAYQSSQEKQYIRNAGGLSTILSNLEMSPYRLRITATAGSGKSLISHQFFIKQQSLGRKILYLCFNRPLAEKMKKQVPTGNSHINTWNGFCTEFLKSKGIILDFGTMKTDLSFWKKVQDQVTGEDITENWLFDTLIVDEGQDFRNEWSEIIRLFTKEDAGILWLEDRDQNLYQTPPVTLEGFTTYRHLVNYRSPYTIAEFIKNTLPFEFIIGNSLPGLGVKSHQYTNPEEQVEIVTSIVHDLRKAGFSNENITLLTCRGIKNSVFSGTDKIGRIKLRNFTGDYDSDGNQIHTEGELLFDSVYRFKGQQAEAIILVDIDPNPNRIQLEEQILFCGMTRATVRLEIVFKRDNSGNQRFMS